MPNGNYVTTLLQPRAKATQTRRVWSLPLDSVVVPYLIAMNTTGQSAIAHTALGAPLRLGYAKDGSVKFNTKGRPIFVVADPIKDAVGLMRENLVANMNAHVHDVATNMKAEFNREVALCNEAGKPLKETDAANLDRAIKARLERELAEMESAPVPEETGERVQERELVPA